VQDADWDCLVEPNTETEQEFKKVLVWDAV
jgi:hypothetical protein